MRLNSPDQKEKTVNLYRQKFTLFRERLAAFLYIIANLPAPFAWLYFPSHFIVRGDPAATTHNITDSESLFHLDIVLNLFTSIGNLILVLALYQLLKVVNKSMASLMVIFMLVGVPIGMLNELNL